MISGAAGYEADDVIGTLAARARGPVDVVTGDRDLFQLVDDERQIRVIYTVRGLTKLDVVRYYLSIAEGALRGIRDRPLVLKRFVNGAEGDAFCCRKMI